MKPSFIHSASLLGILALIPAAASAQYNQTIDVDGTYKPQYIPRERVNVFPERLRFGTLDSNMSFDTRGVVTNFTPFGVPMEATGWESTRPAYPYDGYVELNLGSWLDARVNAGYRFVNNGNTLAGAYLRHNSTSLWKPKVNDYTEDTKRWLYDETIGLYARHIFNGKGMLDADLRYNVTCFNYYGFSPDINRLDIPEAPSQTLNDFNFHVNWKSDTERRLQYHGGIDVRYMGFRRYYDALAANTDMQGRRQTLITPTLGVSYLMGGKSTVGLDLQGDAVIYCKQRTGALSTSPDNYGRLSLTPYYQYNGEGFDFKAGPRIDLMFENGPTLRLAPEVMFGYHTKGIALELSATGGTQLNTLAYQRELSLYCNPSQMSDSPIYTPLDANLKFRFGPFAGFTAGIGGGFRRSMHQPAGGWYTAFLNHNPASLHQQYGYLYDGTDYNCYGFTVGIDLGYKYGRWIEIAAAVNYQPQEEKKSYFNGLDLPEVTGRISVRSNPWSSLKLGVNWDLRANRRPLIYRYVNEPASSAEPTPELINTRIGNWSNLSFDASYDIRDNFTVEFNVDNLLNRRQDLLQNLPSPGITVHAGIVWQF